MWGRLRDSNYKGRASSPLLSALDDGDANGVGTTSPTLRCFGLAHAQADSRSTASAAMHMHVSPIISGQNTVASSSGSGGETGPGSHGAGGGGVIGGGYRRARAPVPLPGLRAPEQKLFKTLFKYGCCKYGCCNTPLVQHPYLSNPIFQNEWVLQHCVARLGGGYVFKMPSREFHCQEHG